MERRGSGKPLKKYMPPPDGIVISPGPKAPQDAGLAKHLIRMVSDKVPIFGVYLGM